MTVDTNQNKGQSEDIRYAFYQNSAPLLSEEEEESLNPILNTLKTSESRYDAPVLMAEGGEKRLYKVYDRRLNRFVAMAHAAKAQTDRDQEQFLREGQLTANLNHPNIVPIHNMGIGSDGIPFFSMELVPGDSLGDIIKKLKDGDADYGTRYGLKIMLGIFNKVCDAVAYAHSRDVLHLDIKPDNIRVGQFGEVFLCDWGLARIEGHIDDGEPEPGQLDSDLLNDMTLSGTMKGTPGFMAPEQILNRNKSWQTDIYALGAILYLILTRQLPVDGQNANEVLDNTLNGNIVHPRKRKTPYPVPTGLVAVAMHALEFEPANRYASVQEFQSDLNRFITGYPTQAEHAGIFTRLALLAQRHRKLTLWIVAFLVLLAIVMSVNLSIIQRGKQIAEKNFTLAEENFALYRTEQEEANRIGQNLSAMAFNAKSILSYASATSMITINAQLLKQDTLPPSRREVLRLYQGQLHLVMQEFNAAAESFEKLTDPNAATLRMLEQCRKYAAIKPNDLEALSDQNIANFLRATDILPRPLAIYTYYHYMIDKRPHVNPEEHIKVVEAMLIRLNELSEHETPALKLTKNPEGYHLDLSHTPYSVYVVHIPMSLTENCLEPLQLHSLDISHTPVSLTRELWELKVDDLRMVGVSLAPTYGMISLMNRLGAKRLIVGKNDYPPNVLERIREMGVDVIEEEYER